MNASDIIKVLHELRVYSRTGKSLNSKTMSCQTDFEDEVDDNNNNLPFIFSINYPSVNEAETQCNIPLSKTVCRECGKGVPMEDATTQCDFTLKGNQKSKQPLKQEQSIDLCISAPFDPRECSIDLAEENPEFIDTSKFFNIEEEISISSNQKEVKPFTIAKAEADDVQNDDVMEGEDSENELFSKRVLQLTELDKELYYSDDERFWEEMGKRQKSLDVMFKQKREKRKRKKLSSTFSMKSDWFESPKDDSACMEKTEKPNNYESYVDGFKDSKRKCGDASLITYAKDMKECKDWASVVESGYMVYSDSNVCRGNFSISDVRNGCLCDICGKWCRKNQSLREHIVKEHPEHDMAKAFGYPCSYCGRLYSKERHLEYHLKQFKGPCDVCGEMLSCINLLCLHRKNHNAFCTLCDRDFATKKAYDNHMKRVHEMLKLECTYCSRKFFSLSQLNVHVLNSHRDENDLPQIHKCHKCAFSTISLKSLNVHCGIIHNTHRTYMCNICHETFDKHSSLDEHRRKHCKSSFDMRCKAECNNVNEGNENYSSVLPFLKQISTSGETDDSDFSVNLSFPCFPCEKVYDTPDELHAHMCSVHDAPMCSGKRPLEQQILTDSLGKHRTPTPDVDSCSSSTLPLSVPSNVVPQGINMVEINGVTYEVVRD